MRKIALSLVLCMLFGLCACSSQPEDLNKSSNPQEAETSQETESSEEFDPDFMLDMQTLERRTGSIRSTWQILPISIYRKKMEKNRYMNVM